MYYSGHGPSNEEELRAYQAMEEGKDEDRRVHQPSHCRALTQLSLPRASLYHSPLPLQSSVSDWHNRAFALVQQRSKAPMLLEPCAHCLALPLCPFLIIDMVRTRGGSRLRPRVRFITQEKGEQAPVPAAVPEAVPEPVPKEPQWFRRYQTRMGPQAPYSVPLRRSRRARPSKRARTSGPGESSSSKPQPSQSPSAA